MKKIVLIFIFLLGFTTTLNAYCYVSEDCENTLNDMQQSLTSKIEKSFDKIDNEIELLIKEYQNELKEIDKELYTARIRLQAEQNLYLKIQNIELLLKKNVQLNSINTTMDIINNETNKKGK